MFHKLTVKEIKQETNNAVSIAFEIPSTIQANFTYNAGQYITIKSVIDGEDVRRAYSLCSAPAENDFRIGVKKVENGKMSTFLNQELKAGQELEVMEPMGNFLLGNTANIVAFAAGSGITPILSMAKHTLKNGGNFSLFYGNKTAAETMFKNDLDALKDSFDKQFELHYIYSRENTDDELCNGRITEEKTLALLQKNLEWLNADGFYSCGPEAMILNVSEALKTLGVEENKIHFELFTAPTLKEADKELPSIDFLGESQVTIIMDGDEFEFSLSSDGDYVLDAAIDNGADAPFSCKGAVCCTCKAQVIEGKANMDMNYALSEEEIEEGFILTCQARPASEKLVIDYDVI